MSSDVPYQDARSLFTAANLVAPALVEWENEPFAEPVADPAQMWVSVECYSRVLTPLEMAGGVWQEEGTVLFHVVTPQNTGSDAARVLAKNIANVYRGLGQRQVVYRNAAIGRNVATDPQGAWWVLTVSVDWIYQDIDT